MCVFAFVEKVSVCARVVSVVCVRMLVRARRVNVCFFLPVLWGFVRHYCTKTSALPGLLKTML